MLVLVRAAVTVVVLRERIFVLVLKAVTVLAPFASLVTPILGALGNTLAAHRAAMILELSSVLSHLVSSHLSLPLRTCLGDFILHCAVDVDLHTSNLALQSGDVKDLQPKRTALVVRISTNTIQVVTKNSELRLNAVHPKRYVSAKQAKLLQRRHLISLVHSDPFLAVLNNSNQRN